MNRSISTVCLALGLVATLVVPLRAQDASRTDGSRPADPVRYAPLRALSPVNRADALYFDGDPRASFALLEEYLKVEPDDYEVLWRAARAAVLLGVSTEGSRPQNRWLDPAMEFGHRAVAVRPDGIDGLYWRGAAHGRRAMNASPGYATELAQQVYDDAHAILELDSLHGGAHNLLGKLSYEVMSLSRFERAVGRLFMGNEALSNASWELAEEHLRTAAEAWPDLVLFQFDLAQLHRKRGNDDDAVEVYRRVLELPAVHPTDLDLQAQARDALEEFGS
jgi:regulator of microtubule dynamics protein 3